MGWTMGTLLACPAQESGSHTFTRASPRSHFPTASCGKHGPNIKLLQFLKAPMMFISQKFHTLLEKMQFTPHIPQSEFLEMKDLNVLVFREENPQSV